MTARRHGWPLQDALRQLIYLGRAVTALSVLLWTTSALATTGAEEAQILNQRYQSTVPSCGANRPAYYCSGVLMRSLPGGESQDFWRLGATDGALGSVPFTYLRSDVGTNILPYSAGFIFDDVATAAGQHKPFSLRCAYPFEAALSETTADRGCDLLGGGGGQSDLSSCARFGVTDAASWVSHFEREGGIAGRQCSLSAMDSGQFKANLEAHERTGSGWSSRPTMVLIEAWNDSRPASLPIQAVFYDISHGGQLSQAQHYQLQYFNATGQWLPIVQVYFGANGKAIFGYDAKDQLDRGYRLVMDLVRRFENMSPVCEDGSPAFFCDGVLIRATGYGSGFHSWNPSPNSVARNGVSFTYLRKDINIKHLLYDNTAVGLIMREFSAPVAYPLTMRCAYPRDMGTGINNTCTRGADARFCDEIGVVSVPTWQASDKLCPFRPDVNGFQLSIDVRVALGAGYNYWNEIIISAWPQNIPDRLPIDVFFYISNLAGAQYIQQDYMNATGKFIPLIKVDLNKSSDQMFIYSPSEQATAKSGSVPAM
ncbi:hypothetical protein [Burkholderia sp. BDU5]|uniref:hypothetical protein n=1 Tax=Burkholderia sp. BDU5 TaxID=1385590 RepID=UPI000AE8E5FD|nr:hypothetical protein [Burkholderia sp. BDU5]